MTRLNVLVTGAAGFLGGHLACALVAAGHRVRALVLPSDDASPLEALGVEIAMADVTRREQLERPCDGCDIVHHLAGLVPTPGCTSEEYFRVNRAGTENVARAAARAGVPRFVYASSVAVYGVPRRAPADESTPPAPRNAYQASKLAAESAVEEATTASGTVATVARLTPVFGPRDLRTLALFRSAARGRVVLIGRGTKPYQLSYVDDVVADLRACGERSGSGFELLNVGTDERVTVRGLVELIVAEVRPDARIVRLPAAPFALAWRLRRIASRGNPPPPGVFDRLDFFLAERIFDVTRAAKVLGSRTRVPLREAIRRTIAWYRAHGHL